LLSLLPILLTLLLASRPLRARSLLWSRLLSRSGGLRLASGRCRRRHGLRRSLLPAGRCRRGHGLSLSLFPARRCRRRHGLRLSLFPARRCRRRHGLRLSLFPARRLLWSHLLSRGIGLRLGPRWLRSPAALRQATLGRSTLDDRIVLAGRRRGLCRLLTLRARRR